MRFGIDAKCGHPPFELRSELRAGPLTIVAAFHPCEWGAMLILESGNIYILFGPAHFHAFVFPHPGAHP